LFHRIYVFPLVLPPLRERREDIPELIAHFANQVSSLNGWKAVPFTGDAIKALQDYAWPGNVRELRNIVERLMLLAANGQVDLETVRLAMPASSAQPAPNAATGALANRVEAFEREVILSELKRSQFNVAAAARALQLERSHLYKKAEQLGIDLQAVRKEQDH
jgi:two-component system nitrogen regulation response regulator NtrX